MNEKQRQRHSELISSLIGPRVASCFETTSMPDKSNIKRYYGSEGKASVWNSLPIPPTSTIGDLAYVDPIHIIKFLFANGIPIDPIAVDPTADVDYAPGQGIIQNVSESKAVCDMVKEVATSPKLDDKSGPPTVILWCMDWRDGFGPQRVKNNRKSVVAWTLSVAPTPDKVNSTDNTFLMAVGLKSSKHWSTLEHRIAKAMSVLHQ